MLAQPMYVTKGHAVTLMVLNAAQTLSANLVLAMRVGAVSLLAAIAQETF